MSPSIDPRTGAVRLDDGTTLGPGLSRAAFLASPLGRFAREGVQNEPWASWVVRKVEIAGRPFSAMICFSNEELGMLDLVLLGEQYGTSWRDQSPENERARRAAHDEWLEAELGEPGRADGADVSAWSLEHCEVVSRFDARACASAIHFRYGWEAEEPDEP